ncbi:growth hormone secretagogue receptor type 1-like, partial [Sphaeramia orbicularis]|uniref:growth hormone secretagogue receptor type 1-like n=1 Tax=Sphaeramia orbicularis TaxID=375764 RepID=UPI00117F7608
SVLYVLLMLLGIVGNVLTLLVVCLRPHMRSSSYLYLSSMAVSDLLILLLLPLDLYKLWRPRPWPFGDLLCKLTMFLSECCTFSSILHITFLSLERYLAVCWPIAAKALLTRRRTRLLIGCLWLAAAVSAAPVLIMVGVEDVDGEEVGECGCTQWAVSSGLMSAMMVLSNVYFLVPFCILGLVYSLIGRTLWLRPQSGRRDQKHKNTVKMLGVIVLSFLLCWLPFHVGRTIFFSLSVGTVTDQQPAHLDSHPHTEADAHPHTEANTHPHTEADAHLHTEANTYLHTQANAHLHTEANAHLYTEADTHLDTEADTHLHTQDDAHLHTEADTHLDTEADTHLHTQANAHLYTEADTHLETEADTHLHTEAYAHLDTEADTHLGTEADAHLGTEADAHLHTDPGAHPPTEANVSLYTEADAHPHTEADAHPPTEADAHPHTEADAHPSTEADAHLYLLYYLSQYLNLVSSVLFYLSAAINPLLYNLMSAPYRRAVYSLVHKRPPGARGQRGHTFTLHQSTTTV